MRAFAMLLIKDNLLTYVGTAVSAAEVPVLLVRVCGLRRSIFVTFTMLTYFVYYTS